MCFIYYIIITKGVEKVSISEINIKYILCNGIEACCTLKVPKQIAIAPIFRL